jgi:tetratricopeptide (TPR) repeat protein
MFKTSQQTREFGEPELAKSQLFFTIENMEKRISLEADNLKDLLDIKFLLIRNYAERMACDNDISLRGETVKAVMPDFAKLMTLAVISKDNHGMALAHSWLAGAYFVDGDHQKAKENADRAVPFFNEDPMMLAETLRGLMIDHALLKDKQGFDLYKFKALEAVENGLIKTPMDIAVIREGIGHSKTVFGQMDAIEDLQAAEREMSKVNALKKPRPVEYLRIYRSVLNYFQRMKDLGKKINYQIYDEYVQKAFRSSTALKDYPRHRKEIEEIIKEFPTYHLNKSAGVKQLGLF